VHTVEPRLSPSGECLRSKGRCGEREYGGNFL